VDGNQSLGPGDDRAESALALSVGVALTTREGAEGALRLGVRDPQVEEAKSKITELWNQCRTADRFECDGETWSFDDDGTLYCSDLSLGSANAALGHDVGPRIEGLRLFLAKYDQIRDAAMKMRDEVMEIAEQGRLLANELAPLLTAGHAIKANGREYWFDGDNATKFGVKATGLFASAGVMSSRERFSDPPRSAMIAAYRNLGADREAIEAVLDDFDAYQLTSDSAVLATGPGGGAFVFRTTHGSLGWPYARSDSRAKESAVSGKVFPSALDANQGLGASFHNMSRDQYASWLFWDGRLRGRTLVVSERKQLNDSMYTATRRRWLIAYTGVRTLGVSAVTVTVGAAVAGTDGAAVGGFVALYPTTLLLSLRAIGLFNNGRYRSTRVGRIITRRVEQRHGAKPAQQIRGGSSAGLGGAS
jgi:hypothetical protein